MFCGSRSLHRTSGFSCRRQMGDDGCAQHFLFFYYVRLRFLPHLQPRRSSSYVPSVASDRAPPPARVRSCVLLAYGFRPPDARARILVGRRLTDTSHSTCCDPRRATLLVKFMHTRQSLDCGQGV